MPYDFTHGQCPWPARNQVWIGRTDASSKGLVVVDDVLRGTRGNRVEWSAAGQLGAYDGRLHGQHSRGACSTRHLLRNYEHWCDWESLVDVLLPHRFAQAEEQGRIDRLIADRTQALAAVSHDLRTPIARLRLRAGFVEDGEAARAIDADLDEMEAMITATLAYLRGEAEQEQLRVTNLAAILETLCDDATDAGRNVSYDGPSQVRLACRPIAIKRALANLINNAVKYGGAARVTLRDHASSVEVAVEDDGPGIPESELEAVFTPFRRLESSRNRETGGTGLGLTIARNILRAHGGDVVLRNRPEGGLSAVASLPG